MSDTIKARIPCEHGQHESHCSEFVSPHDDYDGKACGHSSGWDCKWCDGWQEITLRRVPPIGFNFVPSDAELEQAQNNWRIEGNR